MGNLLLYSFVIFTGAVFSLSTGFVFWLDKRRKKINNYRELCDRHLCLIKEYKSVLIQYTENQRISDKKNIKKLLEALESSIQAVETEMGIYYEYFNEDQEYKMPKETKAMKA